MNTKQNLTKKLSLTQKLEAREFLLDFHDKDTGKSITKLNYDYTTMCGILKTLKSNVRVTLHTTHDCPKIEVEN